MPSYYLRNKKEKDSFDAIVRLYKSDLLGDIGIRIYADDGIEYNDITFVKSEETDIESTVEAKIDNDGASWFAKTAGRAQTSSTEDYANKWDFLVKEVEKKFYEKYSCLVYNNVSSGEFVDQRSITKRIESVLKTFFDFDDSEIGNIKIEINKNDDIEKIYGVNLRMEVYDTGEPKPILCKMFFTPGKEKVVPVSSERAQYIGRTVASIQESTSLSPEVIKETKDYAAPILEKIVDYLKNNDLLDDLVFDTDANGRNVDKEVIDKLLNSVASGEVEILCNSIAIKVLMIINQKVNIYNVIRKSDKQDMLRIKYCAERMSISCAACDDGMDLMLDNEIAYSNGIVEVRFDRNNEIQLYKNNKNVDLESAEGEELLETIKQEVFAKHLLKIKCNYGLTNQRCVKRACICRQEKVVCGYDEEGKEMVVIKCNDCKHLEQFIKIKVDDGYKAYAPDTLYFDVGTKSFVVKDNQTEIGRCEICGREIAKGKRCALCASLNNNAQENKQRELYKKYSYMIPLSNRLFGGKKKCVEDHDIIVFRIDKNYFVVHKRDMLSGMIEAKEIKL